ncbi:hypothetical protein CDV36_000190 [Fusarium kuroshium]|uniref:Oxidoreductase andH n=2 Tax=Fusarium solani species complex TaxID=232080 RepID=A0A3M2SR63_9HYPO|nr:hypothetical protein CDV36_000190 [Fusarium kuroshium]RSM20187.1 hypothetical protein CDV31_000982 [Fusarium ambrosium]
MATRTLVVGGTGGIGYAIASRLAAESSSSTVIISGRNKPQDLPHANMEFRQLDASSMRAIKDYTTAYKATKPPALDYLVLSQGIGTMAGRTETAEGIDNKMALHFYGKQLLIRELLPVLKEDAKILIVLDGKRGNPSSLVWDDLDLKSNFSLANAAAHCITMTDAMVQVFATQQPAGSKRHFIHAFPGFVRTEIFKNLPWYLRTPASALGSLLGVQPDTCAERLIGGTRERAEDGDKLWSFIDEKGHLISNKASWTEQQIKDVEDHTWKVIDNALNMKG